MTSSKKPLLVKFTQDERDFIKKESTRLGVTQTFYIRQMIQRKMARSKHV
jgi:hypothetical protein